MNQSKDIDDYIARFPENVQQMLQQLRGAIREAAPEAIETISYQMPAYKLNGILVYFAGYKNHIGFYPTSRGIEAFKTELSTFTWSKGTVQFPLDKPIPVGLITKIVKFRAVENMEKLKKRANSKS